MTVLQDFGSQLTMEFFNASWISDVIAASGAKYVVPPALFAILLSRSMSC
jgi:hypothetical protein